MLRINDPQKHKALYTWSHVHIINFQYVQDLVFLRIIILQFFKAFSFVIHSVTCTALQLEFIWKINVQQYEVMLNNLRSAVFVVVSTHILLFNSYTVYLT